MAEVKERSLNFIEQIIEEDLKSGKWTNENLQFRFPPEPNGFLHIGHAKSICLNFGLAENYGGKINLRFDDTNPVKEKTDYVDSIKENIKWLGFQWDKECYASDYFQQLYDWAVVLIKKGSAFIDHSTQEEMASMKGSPTEAGVESPFRNRTVQENLDFFEQMKNGDLEEGTCVLRAKIDMTSPNMHFRDPVLYRILKAHHHRTNDDWCIYPLYDFAHGQSDSHENVTHSICTLEFRHHRPLYEWFIKELEIFPSRQIEFARLNMSYTIMSKRRLLKMVEEGHVDGWDDPRMSTIAAFKRRGYTPKSIRDFADKIGVAKRDNLIDISLLEFCARADLNKVANRRMAVSNPIKLVITNFPEGKVEMLDAENNPEDENSGSRSIPFSREIYIERGDVMENAPKKFYRLDIGRNVRLKHAFIIHCDEFVKDEAGEIIEVRCTYYPNSRSGSDESGVKPKGTLHWVSIEQAATATIIEYDRLFNVEEPNKQDGEFTDYINKDSKKEVKAFIEPELQNAKEGEHFQFLRKGYYCLDKTSTPENLVFNRTITLRDTWAKKKK